jgi:hypothetical protein
VARNGRRELVENPNKLMKFTDNGGLAALIAAFPRPVIDLLNVKERRWIEPNRHL